MNDVPWEYEAAPVLASIAVNDDEFDARDIRLEAWEPTGDEAGPIEVGTLGTPRGTVGLVRHVGHPELGIELRATGSAHPGAVAEAVTSALGVPADRAIWVASGVSRAADEPAPYGPA